jgi:anti-sigma factor RsiW
MQHADPPTPTVTEEELHALVDGRLDAHAAAALQARVALDPQASATLAAWRRQRSALHELYGELLDEPVPPALLGTATQAQRLRERQGRWWRWGGMAASVLLAFALGWVGHGRWGDADSLARMPAGAARHFAQQAVVAHAVYMPEVRHPVEVPAAQQEHLVQWLSKRLHRPLKVPNLAAQGYELVGGRLLPGDDGARAQFMFQNAAGARVTLYLGAINAGAASQANAESAKESAFRFVDDGPVSGFYWVDQGFGYALAGTLSRDALLALATAVHRQL